MSNESLLDIIGIAYNWIKPIYNIKTAGLYIAFYENPSDAIVEKCGKRTAVGKVHFITEEIPYGPPY